MKIASLFIGVVIITCIFSVENLHVKNQIVEEWNKIYTNLIGQSRDIIETDKGFLITGYVVKDEWPDIFLLYIDKNGNELWNKTYGGKFEDVGEKLLETANGYFIEGYTESYGNGGADFWVIKVDKQGNEIWNRTYGGRKDDFAEDIISVNNGYIMIGYTESYGRGGDIWVVKIDENGNEIWNRTYGGNGYEWGNDILQTDGGYIICGVTSSYGKGGWDFWIIKIDDNGKEIWNKTYGYWDMEWAKDIIEVDDGYIIGGDTTTTLTGWNDILLLKIDKQGNEIWNKTYGGKDVDSLSDIIKTGDGYTITGITESFDVGFFDGWMLRIDENGNEIWNKSFGGRGRDTLDCILYCNDGYIMAGSFSRIIENDGRITEPCIWVIKTIDIPPSSIKITKPENGIYVFDRKLFPYNKKLILGSITIVVSPVEISQDIEKVAFYLSHSYFYDYEPREIDYSPPYEWKWNEKAIGLYEITVAAYYGNAGAVVADKIEVYIINLFPSPSKSSLAKTNSFTIKGWVPQNK